MSDGHAAAREPSFLLAAVEKRALTAIAPRLPRWVLPDHLTALGMLASLGFAAAYIASNASAHWLWLAVICLAVNWFGDSLDGTVARERGIQRPKYGYYLDHLVDAFSTLAIGLGLGLSPYMLLSLGLFVIVAYLICSINVYLEASTLSRFDIGYGKIGPTEVRIILATVTAVLALGVNPSVVVFDNAWRVLDPLAVVMGVGMLVMMLVRAVGNLRQLAKEEPANTPRPPA